MDEEVPGEAGSEQPVQYAEVYFEYHEPTEEAVRGKTEQPDMSVKTANQGGTPPEQMEVDEIPLGQETVAEHVPHVTEQIVSTTSTPETMSDVTPPPTDTDIVTVIPPEAEPSGEKERFQSAAPSTQYSSPHSQIFEGGTTLHAALFEGDSTPLNAPVKELKEKWKLLPAFLQVNFIALTLHLLLMMTEFHCNCCTS